MRLLVVAYEFPPVPSPQALRWAYLVRELSLAGHDVHVLAPDVEGFGRGGLPAIPEDVTVHRVYPGPFAAWMASRLRRRRKTLVVEGRVAAVERDEVAGEPPELNWKGKLRYACLSLLALPARAANFFVRRLFGRSLNWKGGMIEGFKAIYGFLMFPDVRSEWMPWARRDLVRVLQEFRPDVVITSHEPANTILLGAEARRRGFRWVADLGDPVLAPYTPRRWRRRAEAVERMVCDQADVITVTSQQAADTLSRRHGLSVARCKVVTQGFDGTFEATLNERLAVSFDPSRLELLYTGSFYSFRRADELLQAVIELPGVRLSIATVCAPEDVRAAARAHPDRIRLLGFLAHREAVAAQKACDVLVSIANADPVQVPGKLYEYLGSGRPVLHIGGQPGDAARQLLEQTGTGVCVSNDHGRIREQVLIWCDQKSRGVSPCLDRQDEQLAPYRWDRLAVRVATLCQAGGT